MLAGVGRHRPGALRRRRRRIHQAADARAFRYLPPARHPARHHRAHQGRPGGRRHPRTWCGWKWKSSSPGSFLEGAPIVPVSSVTGAGLDDLRTELARVAAAVPEKNARGHFRLPIDRVFSVKGFGTVVTGTLISGSVAEGAGGRALSRGPAPARARRAGPRQRGRARRRRAAHRRQPGRHRARRTWRAATCSPSPAASAR